MVSIGSDQKFEKNSDMAKLISTYEKTKKKLIDVSEREKIAIAEKNTAIKQLLMSQHELEEAKAEIAILTKALTP